MVNLNDVRAASTVVVQTQPLVAVFFGGTSGIGHYTVRALATEVAKSGNGLRAYIVGRNAKAAEDITAECRQLYPDGQYQFVKVDDLSLLANVDQACSEIIELEKSRGDSPRIDYLMVSQGGVPFKPRKDTTEGIDVTMSLMYYSRMKVITALLPLLLNSTLPARIVSIYAAGMEDKFYPDDLSLRDLSRYSYSLARSHMCYMHTLFMESLAEQHRGKLSLVHIFPGIVMGPTFSSPELPAWFRVIWNWVVFPLFGRFLTVPSDECGQRMLSLASPRYPPRPLDGSLAQKGAAIGTDGKIGSGVYSLTWNGESNEILKAYGSFDKDEMRKKVWEHTVQAFKVIQGGGVFTE